jgi:3D (Asp-Asp-Asp) domain-containing protein
MKKRHALALTLAQVIVPAVLLAGVLVVGYRAAEDLEDPVGSGSVPAQAGDTGPVIVTPAGGTATPAEQLKIETAPVEEDKPEETPVEEREPAQDKLQQANRIDDCLVTYYCCELYPHICGTGDGFTASGAPVEPGVSCAVDPSLIPFGSTVWVDYGDGELHEYIAQDVGAWVNGGHIDLAVATHDEALQMGRRTATVYWMEG